jgi:stage V sporulation protein B
MTASGVISRMIGFFYRIFLSRTIGAEGLGIYQLIAPVFSICFALTASSIQTSISKFVGDSIGQCSDNECGEKRARTYLFIGLILSCALSLPVTLVLYQKAGWIAEVLLKETRCEPLLVLLSLSILPCCIHACINGYYYGKKRAFIPSACQIIEQCSRVGSVWIFYQITMEKGIPFTAYHAVAGLVISEFAGLLFCGIAFAAEKRIPLSAYRSLSKSRGHMARMFGAMVFPLTLNRLIVALSSSLENLLIPQKLQLFGYSNADALGIYGVLTGMTMSIILLPGVLTNSFSVLLLPEISEAKGQDNMGKIARAIQKAVLYGLLLGLVFTVLFLLSGDWIGNHLFHNSLAGVFIRKLSWICPLMYITSLLGSILHGLGRAGQVLFVNLLACLIRISMIWFLVPVYGIRAYLWGLLLASVFTTIACMILLYHSAQK